MFRSVIGASAPGLPWTSAGTIGTCLAFNYWERPLLCYYFFSKCNHRCRRTEGLSSLALHSSCHPPGAPSPTPSLSPCSAGSAWALILIAPCLFWSERARAGVLAGATWSATGASPDSSLARGLSFQALEDPGDLPDREVLFLSPGHQWACATAPHPTPRPCVCAFRLWTFFLWLCQQSPHLPSLHLCGPLPSLLQSRSERTCSCVLHVVGALSSERRSRGVSRWVQGLMARAVRRRLGLHSHRAGGALSPKVVRCFVDDPPKNFCAAPSVHASYNFG